MRPTLAAHGAQRQRASGCRARAATHPWHLAAQRAVPSWPSCRAVRCRCSPDHHKSPRQPPAAQEELRSGDELESQPPMLLMAVAIVAASVPSCSWPANAAAAQAAPGVQQVDAVGLLLSNPAVSAALALAALWLIPRVIKEGIKVVVVPATVLLVGYLAASHPETTSAALVGTYGWVSEHPAITSAGILVMTALLLLPSLLLGAGAAAVLLALVQVVAQDLPPLPDPPPAALVSAPAPPQQLPTPLQPGDTDTPTSAVSRGASAPALAPPAAAVAASPGAASALPLSSPAPPASLAQQLRPASALASLLPRVSLPWPLNAASPVDVGEALLRRAPKAIVALPAPPQLQATTSPDTRPAPLILAPPHDAAQPSRQPPAPAPQQQPAAAAAAASAPAGVLAFVSPAAVAAPPGGAPAAGAAAGRLGAGAGEEEVLDRLLQQMEQGAAEFDASPSEQPADAAGARLLQVLERS